MGFLMAEQYSLRQSLRREFLSDFVAALIVDKSKTKLAVWSYLIRHLSEHLENAAPPTTIEMGVVHINSLCLGEFAHDCSV